MKTASILLSIMIMALTIESTPAAEGNLDIRDGISDIKWGTTPDMVKAPTKVFKKEDILYLKKTGEKFILKDVNLGSVLYGFFDNKFFAAFMRIRSQDDAEKIKVILVENYGPMRRQLRVNETIYIWDYHDIKIKLKERENDTVFKLSFYYKPLSVKLNEIKMDKSSEITMDLVPAR